MLRALSTSATGMQAQQLIVDTISNNLANVNTAGFKSSRVTFAELLSNTIRQASQPTATAGGTNPVFLVSYLLEWGNMTGVIGIEPVH